MPMGINTSVGVHYVTFAAIKLAGYSLFALHLNKQYDQSHNIWKVGFFRMVLGVLLGAPFGYLFYSTPVFFVGIALLRVLEWVITILLFYDRRLADKKKLTINTIKGIAVSFILDIPAIFGFMVTGGLWIC